MTGVQVLGVLGVSLFITLLLMLGRINWKAIKNGFVDYRTTNINTLVFVCAVYIIMSLAVMVGMIFDAKIIDLAAAASAVAAFIIVLAILQGFQPKPHSFAGETATALLRVPRRVSLSVFFVFLGLTVVINSHVSGFLVWERFF